MTTRRFNAQQWVYWEIADVRNTTDFSLEQSVSEVKKALVEGEYREELDDVQTQQALLALRILQDRN